MQNRQNNLVLRVFSSKNAKNRSFIKTFCLHFVIYIQNAHKQTHIQRRRLLARARIYIIKGRKPSIRSFLHSHQQRKQSLAVERDKRIKIISLSVDRRIGGYQHDHCDQSAHESPKSKYRSGYQHPCGDLLP